MEKDNVKIKEEISFSDMINAIEMTVDYCFPADASWGDTGYLKYAPYFYDAGLTVAIAYNFLDGLTFKKDEDMYAVYNSIVSDNEIMEKVNNIMPSDTVTYVKEQADKLMSFRKEEVLNNNAAIFEIILRNSNESPIDAKVKEILDKEKERLDTETRALKAAEDVSKAQERQIKYNDEFMEQFTPEEYADLTRQAADKDFDMNEMADIVADKFFESPAFNESVIDLQEYKEENGEDNTKKKAPAKRTTTKKNTGSAKGTKSTTGTAKRTTRKAPAKKTTKKTTEETKPDVKEETKQEEKE